MTSRRLVLIAGALMLGNAAPMAAGQLTLEAQAGLGGISRPGRWTPVRVTIENTGDDVSGVLVVTWGDAEVRRDVTIPSPSRKQFHVYLRTSNVESVVRVRLLAKGIEVRALDAPVRLAGASETMTLCVHPRGVLDVSGESCDARVAAGMLPDAARGYDAFDRVVWSGGAQALEPSEREAFRRAQSLRELEESGSLDGTPHVGRPMVPRGLPTDSRRVVAFGAAFYLIALIGIALAPGATRGSTLRVYLAIGFVAGLGSTAALALGRMGPAKAVVVQHSTVLQQLAHGEGAAVSMRAVAEFPAYDAFTLRGRLDDGVIEAIRDSEKAQHIFDEQGAAVLTGTFGLGARQAFTLEGFTPFQPLELKIDGARVRVTNRSTTSLRDCRFADGFSVREVGTLQPTQTVETFAQGEAIAGPVVTCAMSQLPFEFSEATRMVRAQGLVRIAAYREGAR